MNKIQEELIIKIKEAICSNVEYYPVRHNAIAVATPFIDWSGERMEIYITEEGNITDGEQTINQMRALNSFKDFLKWPHRSGYFANYNINRNDDNLDLHYPETSQGILRYIQGIARLPGFFEAKPLGEKQDKFPSKVRKIAINALLPRAPPNLPEGGLKWASKFVEERRFPLNGYEAKSDMSPNKYLRMIQIISHMTSSGSDRKQHIESKVIQQMLAKEKYPEIEMYAVIESLDVYKRAERALLEKKSKRVIEMENEKIGGKELTELLVEEEIA